MTSQIQRILKEAVSGKEIYPSDIPNTMSFWHGGNLDSYDDFISQKKGRYEFGAGLYLTTLYNTARNYSKGNRKLYLVVVEKGQDISDSFIDEDKIREFVNSFVISSKRKMVLSRLARYRKGNMFSANVLNNIILNEYAVSAKDTKYLRSFLVENGIDYEIIGNASENIMVLYNMKKIVDVVRVNPNDRVKVYDLKNGDE